MNHLQLSMLIMCCFGVQAGVSAWTQQTLWASPPEKPAQKEPTEKKDGPPDRAGGDAKRKGVEASRAILDYRPPLRGSPGGRVGGGTRGIPLEGAIRLYALVPDHVGLTVHEQPQLYWFISKLPPCPVEFTLIEVDSAFPLIKEPIKRPNKAGIQCYRLASHRIGLRESKRYKWFITLVLEPDRRSKEVFSGGFIERIPISGELVGKLREAGRSGEPYVYAKEGIWYDALTAISELIRKAPGDELLRRKRASLLEQVGLKEVASFEAK